ncbi:MAG: hypothetical protein JWN44_1628 [Myxococcales bacterium]|nr:hypothetical protein [Myxococcales bacterium]
MPRGRAIIGTSGWIYKHWNGLFYPEKLPGKRQLAYMAEHFDTVEVNGTFYSLSRPRCFEKWRQDTPDGFVFALKGSRYLTHMLKLKNPRAPLANFYAQGVLLLGEKIGPFLWQLPPMFGFDSDRTRAFLDLLPRDLADAERLARKHDARLNGRSALRAPDGHGRPLRHAFEIRHASWLCEEALQLLAEYEVALVTADTADHHPLSMERTTDDFAYVRLHGARKLYASRYTDEELDDWAALVDGWRSRGSDVYVYFDNDDKAYAPGDARRLHDRLYPRLGESPVDARP